MRRLSPFAGSGEDAGGRLGRAFTAERSQDSVNLFEAVANHAQSLKAAGKRVRLLKREIPLRRRMLHRGELGALRGDVLVSALIALHDTLANVATALQRSPLDDSPEWAKGARWTTYGLNAYFEALHPPYYGVSLSAPNDSARTVFAAPVRDHLKGLVPRVTVNPDHFMPMFWGTPAKVPSYMGGTMVHARQWDAARGLPRSLWHDLDGRRANYLFADGHAKSHRFEETWSQVPGLPPLEHHLAWRAGDNRPVLQELVGACMDAFAVPAP